MIIYAGMPDAKTLDITISEENGTHIISPTGEKIPVISSVFRKGKIHSRHYNLELLSYGFDSSREIAVDIIKNQIKEALAQQTLFDIDIDVLLAERIEKELKKFRNKNMINCNQKKLSLYSNDISVVIDNLKKSGIYNEDTDRIITFCEVLNLRINNANTLLDIEPDINLKVGQTSYWYDELYSDEQLVHKVQRILKLTQNAVLKIVTDIIPVLSLARTNTQIIGIVHRKDRFAGVSYINVKVESRGETAPIIEFRENDIEVYPKLDEYYVEKLKQIGEDEQGVIGFTSSLLNLYFGDNVFHDMIYKEVKDLFGRVLGKI